MLWTQRGAAKKSAAAGRLLRVLALRKQVRRVSPLVDAHVAGDLNVLGDIPSRLFGYSKQWHCTNHSEFISLINFKFPLPHQRSWRGFSLSFALRGYSLYISKNQAKYGHHMFVMPKNEVHAVRADHANKPREGLGNKQSGNGRKSSIMDCVGRNRWHRKPPL